MARIEILDLPLLEERAFNELSVQEREAIIGGGGDPVMCAGVAIGVVGLGLISGGLSTLATGAVIGLSAGAGALDFAGCVLP